MVAREYGGVFILCWAHPNARTWELHKSCFTSAALNPLIVEFTEVGPAPRLCKLYCQGSGGVEWPARRLGEGWGIYFLINMLWETGSGALGFQEEISLGPNGKELQRA